ncbi:hypothetical protein N9174_02435 [bacterium]|nr:hypothetical protein [bacterium]
MTIPKTLIRKADTRDISLLSGIIRDAFLDVAKRFALTPENCPKHPSNCTDSWIERDFARGVNYYILEGDGTALGCVALERATAESLTTSCRSKGVFETSCCCLIFTL